MYLHSGGDEFKVRSHAFDAYHSQPLPIRMTLWSDFCVTGEIADSPLARHTYRTGWSLRHFWDHWFGHWSGFPNELGFINCKPNICLISNWIMWQKDFYDSLGSGSHSSWWTSAHGPLSVTCGLQKFAPDAMNAAVRVGKSLWAKPDSLAPLRENEVRQ